MDHKVVYTILEANTKLRKRGEKPLTNATHYKLLVGETVYLTITRPNISHIVDIMNQFKFSPQATHYVIKLYILCDKCIL